MTTKFEYVKLFIENIKVIIPVVIMLVSALGWTVTDNIGKSKEIKNTQDQIAVIANHYNRPEVKEVKEIVKIVREDCGKCAALVHNHIQEYHK